MIDGDTHTHPKQILRKFPGVLQVAYRIFFSWNLVGFLGGVHIVLIFFKSDYLGPGRISRRMNSWLLDFSQGILKSPILCMSMVEATKVGL